MTKLERFQAISTEMALLGWQPFNWHVTKLDQQGRSTLWHSPLGEGPVLLARRRGRLLRLHHLGHCALLWGALPSLAGRPQ